MVVYTGMLPLDNEQVKGLTKPTEQQKFQAEYVEELKRARDSIFFDTVSATSLNMDSTIVMLRINISVHRERLQRKSWGYGWKVPVSS